MLSLGAAGSRLVLDITDYQFPDAAKGEWDAEWLLVSGQVEFEGRHWIFHDPCLTTFELAAIALWLRGIPLGMPSKELSFTEDNLRFEFVQRASGDFLTVWFAQQSSPPWATDREKYIDGIPIHIPSSLIDFVDAAKAVEKLCQRFPERAVRHGA